jgi:hypothetical protein
MTEIEDRLRQELKTQAERINPGQLRPLAVPRSRGRSRARRWLVPLAALAAVVVVIGGVALAVALLPSRPVPVSASRPALSGGLPSRPAADPPAVAVVLQSRAGNQQQVSLLSPVTGRILRQVTYVGGSLTDNGMALSPDSRFVYVTMSGPGLIHIDRISVATGHRGFVADGAQPAVSPDGRYLAYATGPQFTGIAVRDLASGRTTMIPLRSQLGADTSLLTGQVSWLGNGTQIVVRPAADATAAAAWSPAAPFRSSCGRQSSTGRLCLVLVSLGQGKPRARQAYLPGNWGNQPLISGDVAGRSTFLLAGSSAGHAILGAATVTATGITVQFATRLPQADALPVAFAPGGDRFLYLVVSGRGHPQPALWAATISGRRLSGAHRLFTDNSKVAVDWAAW